MKDINSLFSDVYDLQRLDFVVDTRLVVNDGEVAIHWPEVGLAGADNQCRSAPRSFCVRSSSNTIQCYVFM